LKQKEVQTTLPQHIKQYSKR